MGTGNSDPGETGETQTEFTDMGGQDRMDSVSEKPKRTFTGKRCDITTLPKCGAKAKSTGKPCRRPKERNPYTGKLLRCRWHGSRATGPRTPEGLARVAAAHFKHGRYTKAAKEARKQLRERLKALKALKPDGSM